MNTARPKTATRRAWIGAMLIGAALGSFHSATLAGDPKDDDARAVALYDAGSYSEARPLLERRVAAGATDGATLYRLYFCQREAGDDAARETLLSARAALEAELPTAKRLEVPFYLANVYTNTARLSEARRIAQEATTRVESGGLTPPADGMGMFQLGKLYADQERADEARGWYEKSVKAFAGTAESLPPSAQWAARYLGEQALDQDDFAAAERNFAALMEAGTATVSDLNRLAIVRVRTGDFEGASTAWRKAGILNPVEGDHPRYCARLAQQAVEIGGLPATAPDGRGWTTLSPAELEAHMGDSAAAAGDILAAAPPTDDLAKERVVEINSSVVKHRALFIRAALEYAIRGLPIRETAFRGGYAPMIFHGELWRLPPRTPKQLVFPANPPGAGH